MLVVKMTDQFAEHEIVRHEIIGHENAGREHDGPKMKTGREIAGEKYSSNRDNITRWRRSVVVSALASINVVNRHWARLVLGWVNACGRVNHLGM